MSHSSVFGRQRTMKSVTAVAAFTLTAMLGASLETAVAQPVSAQDVTAAAVVQGTQVTIGTATYAVAGTNIPRDADALVVYKSPVTTTTTNMWGVEVTVANGKVTQVNDREKSRSTTGTKVPTGGAVLSGHGKAADWLRANAKVGAAVSLPGEVTPAPAPAPSATLPAAGQSITVGTASRTVTGVNVDREVDALVAYGAPVKVTTTNMWGVEVTVADGKITAVNDREKSRSTTGTTVPANGYVLSGHGQSAEWLRTAAKVGTAVAVSTAVTPTPAPAPAPTPEPAPTTPVETSPAPVGTEAPMGLPSKVRAVYHMMWSNSGSPKLSNTAAGINVVNLSFLQGDKPKIVGWGSQSEASFIADAKVLRAKGVRIVASVGGAHGNVNVRNREAFVQGVMELNAKVTLDGLDWDIEGSTPMPAADVVWISKRLKELRGPKFAITLAPNGSNIDAYRAIAVELQKQGALDMIGQQFYDAVVSKEAAFGRVRQLVQAGIPQEKIAIGMMVGSQDVYWTIEECVTAVKFITATYPNIRGGYLWEAGRAGTADWASKMTALFPGA